ncbi:MAG: PQQ-binding-like beta-propeller repeat protein [Phycisphaerae bacterium]|nr:PQQ-binding-like beta-propeller repeat protein [Phycisphaerae bacterium]
MVMKAMAAFGIIACAVGLLCSYACGAETWPTLHNDYQRSGYTEEVVRGPFERKWFRDFHGEMIASRVEAIVAEGKCFVPTFAGHVYALDIADGRTLWRYAAGGPIGHSPCWHEGKLYFGADEAFNAGGLYCVNASDGRLVWKYGTGAGLWTSPACDGEKVYVGDRAGVFHAVDAATGRPAWTFDTGYTILTPASFSADRRRIVFASEDMHVYCVDPEGRLLWKSRKLPGLSLRDHGPTIWKGLAIVRTNPGDGYHTAMGLNGDMLKRVQREIPLGPDDKVLLDDWGDYIVKETPRRRAAEKAAVVAYLGAHPDYETFFAMSLEDGERPWAAQVLYTCGLHNPATPPTFDPRTGRLYTFYRTAMTNYLRGIRRYSAVGELERESGLIGFSWPETRHNDWNNFAMIGDETQALSLMGNVLLCTHQGELKGLDLETMRAVDIYSARDTYGGIFGPAAVKGLFEGAKKLAEEGWLTGMPNEWHGPDRSIVAVAAGRIFWVVGSQVVCIAGPDVVRTATGGTEPPAMMKNKLDLIVGGNMTSAAQRFDEDLPRITIPDAAVEGLIESPPAADVRPAGGRLADEVRGRLDAEVSELVNGGPYAPFIVELGIVREEAYFTRTAETLQIVALALPHLSAGVRESAAAYLRSMVEGGAPLDEPVHAYAGAKAREIHDRGPGMRNYAGRAPRHTPGVEDLYSLWVCAHYADLWPLVLARVDRIEAVADAFLRKPFSFDHNDMRGDAAQRLNGQIAGVVGYIRIMQKAGRVDRVGAARERLKAMLAERVHHERADSRLVRFTDNGQGNASHNAKIPRYVDLVPEVAGFVARHAGEKFAYHVRGLDRQLPVWYQAWGERMIGGENYVSPPHLARGVFVGLADGLQVPAGELAKKLDQPWCRADLYYIEKASALLRRLDKTD